MAVKKHKMKNGTEYTVSYSAMRGVDFSSDDGELRRYRFAYLENMYKDYEGGGAGIVESIPGFRKLYSLQGKIHSLFSHQDSFGNEYLVIHAKDKLYRTPLSLIDDPAVPEQLISVSNNKSRGFTSGTDLYVLDGVGIVKIDGSGYACRVSEESAATPYIPTTYYNGREYEQRNLLTNKFREIYTISSASDMAAESEGLKYRIISADECLAAVSGIDESFGGEVNIPSYVTLSGIKYKVTEIDERAFELNKNITRVAVSDTVKLINVCAFSGCASLKEVVLSDSVERIERAAFFACSTLDSFYLGAGTKYLNVGVFLECPMLKNINYSTLLDWRVPSLWMMSGDSGKSRRLRRCISLTTMLVESSLGPVRSI